MAKDEPTKVYTARHTIVRMEKGARREYVAGQPISATDEEAKRLLDKKAIYADKAEADAAAKAQVEGVRSETRTDNVDQHEAEQRAADAARRDAQRREQEEADAKEAEAKEAEAKEAEAKQRGATGATGGRGRTAVEKSIV